MPRLLIFLVVAFLGALWAVLSSAAEVTFANDKERAYCEAGGGCFIVSKKDMREAMEEAFRVGTKTAAPCGPKT